MGRGYFLVMYIRDGSILATLAAREADVGVVGYEMAKLVKQAGEERRVAAELVQHEAAEELPVLLRQERPGAVEVRERAAAVDVRDEQHGGAGDVRAAHVREVGVAEVDLRGTARALEHDELVLGEQAPQRVLGDGPERAATLAPGKAAEREIGPAEDDDLAARVALRLDEHRIHAHVGLDAGREGLQVLRDADLPAGDDAGVVRHVLRLERDDVDPAPPQRTAERRRHEALPRRARAALHHEPRHARSARRGKTKTLPWSSWITRTLAP